MNVCIACFVFVSSFDDGRHHITFFLCNRKMIDWLCVRGCDVRMAKHVSIQIWSTTCNRKKKTRFGCGHFAFAIVRFVIKWIFCFSVWINAKAKKATISLYTVRVQCGTYQTFSTENKIDSRIDCDTDRWIHSAIQPLNGKYIFKRKKINLREFILTSELLRMWPCNRKKKKWNGKYRLCEENASCAMCKRKEFFSSLPLKMEIFFSPHCSILKRK